MPLESPYPPDYEQAGIPLPGPALNAPMVARPALAKPQLPPHEQTPEPSDLRKNPRKQKRQHRTWQANRRSKRRQKKPSDNRPVSFPWISAPAFQQKLLRRKSPKNTRRL